MVVCPSYQLLRLCWLGVVNGFAHVDPINIRHIEVASDPLGHLLTWVDALYTLQGVLHVLLNWPRWSVEAAYEDVLLVFQSKPCEK